MLKQCWTEIRSIVINDGKVWALLGSGIASEAGATSWSAFVKEIVDGLRADAETRRDYPEALNRIAKLESSPESVLQS